MTNKPTYEELLKKVQELENLHFIAERKRVKEALHRSDEILRAVAFSAKHFLQNPNINNSAPQVLKQLGEATRVSRVYIFENNIDNDGVVLSSQRFEWAAPGITPQINNPELQEVPMVEAGFGRWFEILSQNKPVSGIVADFPDDEQDLLKAQNISSIAIVPIFKGNNWWGFMGFDDCINKQEWTQPEIEVLSAAADIFGTAINKLRVEEELRASEERYSLAMRGANDGLWDRDLKTGETYFSPRCKEMLGYKDKEIPSSYEEWGELLHPDDYDRVMVARKDHFNGQTQHYIAEYRMRHKDGTYRWILARGATIRDDNGKPVRFAGSHTDITNQKKMESEMLKTQKLESVGILAGGIAHDFNNILTVIMGNIFIAKNFIKKNLKKEELLEILSTLEKASVRAKDLTQQLLTFSKGGAPVFKTTSVAEILKESANFALRGSSIKCETSIAKNLWNIEIDEGQISQVINNMVINAKQAINIGGMVTISAENIQITFKESLPIKNGRYIVITINDTGDGIPEEILSKIFDPYFSTKKEGSGLGLASSYSIIKKHKGHIAVKSDVDVGTIFHIYLPASTKDIPVQKKEVKRKHLLQGRILVLEDDEMVKKTTAMMLSETGYETKFASDGKKAVEIYQKAMETGNPFDVVILDLTIPGGMGGEEAMKELRKINPDIKGIACSGYSNSSVMSNYKRYGFSGVLPKPYNTEKLIGVLSKIFI